MSEGGGGIYSYHLKSLQDGTVGESQEPILCFRQISKTRTFPLAWRNIFKKEDFRDWFQYVVEYRGSGILFSAKGGGIVKEVAQRPGRFEDRVAKSR